MTNNWKAVLGVILIYTLGCFSGAVSTSIFFEHKLLGYLQHPEAALSMALEKRLTRNLDLDANQRQRVHACFMENLEHRQELQKTIQPQVHALNRQTLQQIVAILNPDQAQLFHENIERVRRRFSANASDQAMENPPAPPAQPGDSATNSATSHPPPGQ